MPSFNRRKFLQVASAAGLAPALPAFSAGSAASAANLTAAQKLWISLYANAEKTASLPSLSRSMGISAETAKGVYARLIRTQAIAAQGAVRLAQSPTPTAPSPHGTSETMRQRSVSSELPEKIRTNVQKLLTEDADHASELEDDVDNSTVSET